jgi:hypothetical protein
MRIFPWLMAALFAMELPARAYLLQFNLSTNVVHWNFLAPDNSVPTNVLSRATHAVRFFLASDGYSTTNTAAELNAIRAAFGQWQAISNTVIKFEDAGLVPPPVDVNTSDGTNILYWTKTTTLVNGGHSDISGALGVTFISMSVPNNEILQADIVFNGVLYSWFTDFFNSNAGNNTYFVEAIALHEIGHFIGLSHSPLGGATMFYAGGSGVNVQDGLSSDDVAGARALYSTTPAVFGAIAGTVTLNGTPVVGAIVTAEDAASNTIAGTLTWTNGNYAMNALPPGAYLLRVSPLDPAGARSIDALCTGPDIKSVYNTAFTSFPPTTNQAVTVTANSTNTVNFTVISNVQPFRVSKIRAPTANSGSYSWSALPTVMTAGQSGYTIGVASSNLPTSGASFTITGDGLTLGTPTFQSNPFTSFGLNFISVTISIASNATPGLRSFIVQQGTNTAYASGFLKIRPAVLDYNFDGLDDAFQRTYFPVFTATNAAPATDPDGDGMNNLSEYIAGTIPTNAASVFKLLTPTNSLAAGTTVRWLSVSNKVYQVSSRTNLASGSWQNLGSTVTAGSTNALLLDAAGTNGIRFYRVEVLP